MNQTRDAHPPPRAPSSSREAEPDTPPCPRCHDAGFLTRAGPRHAEAVVCRHLANCRVCRGTGRHVHRDSAGHDVLAPCPCGLAEIAARVQLYNRAGIPPRFHDSRLSAFRVHHRSQAAARSHFERIRNGFQAGAKGVGLFGPPGVGKTHLLTGVAGWMTLTRGVEVRYADFSGLIAEIKRGFDQGLGEARVIEPVARVPVLMIDELGKGRGSDWERGVIDQIVSQRYNAGLSTFFATNYRANPGQATRGLASELELEESLRARLGVRVWSRLQEMCTLMEIDGPDARAEHTDRAATGRHQAPRGLRPVPPRPR